MRSPRSPLAAALILITAFALQVAGANPAVSQTPALNVWAASDPGLDPAAPVWDAIPPLDVPLTAQGQTYPTGTVTVPVIHARAITSRGVLYVRLDWADATRDDQSVRTEQFADAVALEFPANAATSVPSVCMGQADTGVNIWQWRADSEREQALSVTDAFADGYLDLPSPLGDAGFTARTVGNPYAVAHTSPVQDLVAVGLGTIGPAASQSIRGGGTWRDGSWKVVFARPLAGPGPDRPSFALHTQTDLALAVWNGRNGDRNGKKMISSFLRLNLSNDVFPPIRTLPGTPPVIWALGITPLGAMLLSAASAGVYALRRRP